MKLPDITLGAVPDAVGPALEGESSAIKGLSKTLADGLAYYGREVLKDQAASANLDLSQGLNDIESELRTRKAIPVDEARARLGPAFDMLPAGVRDQPTVRTIDPTTGAVIERQADIPTWAIASQLFDAQAKQALANASKRITVGVGSGWQADFQKAALPDLMARRNRINDAQLSAMHQDLALRRDAQWQAAARAGDFSTAKLIVDSSGELYGSDGQLKRQQAILGMAQVRPVYDALLAFRSDPTAPASKEGLEAAMVHLSDQNQVSQVPTDHLDHLSREVRAALKQADSIGEKRTAADVAFQIANDPAYRDTDHPDLVDPAKAFDALDAKFAAGGALSGRPELRADAGTLLQKFLGERNERANYVFDKTAGTAIREYLAMDANGQPHAAMSNLNPSTIAALEAQGKKGEDLLESFRLKDRANELEARQMRQLPTDAQAGYLLNLETWMRKHPDQVRATDPDTFAATHFPNLPTPYFNRVLDLFATLHQPTAAVRVEAAKDQVDDLLKQSGLLPTQRGKRVTPMQVEARNQLQGELSRFMTSETAAGRPPDDKAVGEWIRQRLMSVEVRGTFLQRLFHQEQPRIRAEVEGTPYLDPETGQVVKPATKPAPRAAPPAAPSAPAGAAPAVGQRVPSEKVTDPSTGQPFPPGGVFEMQPNGKYRRVQ